MQVKQDYSVCTSYIDERRQQIAAQRHYLEREEEFLNEVENIISKAKKYDEIHDHMETEYSKLLLVSQKMDGIFKLAAKVPQQAAVKQDNVDLHEAYTKETEQDVIGKVNKINDIVNKLVALYNYQATGVFRDSQQENIESLQKCSGALHKIEEVLEGMYADYRDSLEKNWDSNSTTSNIITHPSVNRSGTNEAEIVKQEASDPRNLAKDEMPIGKDNKKLLKFDDRTFIHNMGDLTVWRNFDKYELDGDAQSNLSRGIFPDTFCLENNGRKNTAYFVVKEVNRNKEYYFVAPKPDNISEAQQRSKGYRLFFDFRGISADGRYKLTKAAVCKIDAENKLRLYSRGILEPKE